MESWILLILMFILVVSSIFLDMLAIYRVGKQDERIEEIEAELFYLTDKRQRDSGRIFYD